MLENPDALESMVHESGARSTDLEEKEPVEQLCGKCRNFADEWAPVAQELWEDPNDPRHSYREDITSNMSKSDTNKFKKLGRTL